MNIYLKILLSVEDNGLCLHFSIFNIHFVPTENNRDILTHSHQIPMPIWYILVCDPSCDIKHDNGTLTLDVVAISQASELLLACSVPDVKSDWTSVGIEHQRMYLNTKGGCNCEGS